MTACQVTDPGRSGQTTQSCPACDGTMPAEAVQVGRWRMSGRRGEAYERTVSMHCPHCDYKQRRLEIIPQTAFLMFAKLNGDR